MPRHLGPSSITRDEGLEGRDRRLTISQFSAVAFEDACTEAKGYDNTMKQEIYNEKTS